MATNGPAGSGSFPYGLFEGADADPDEAAPGPVPTLRRPDRAIADGSHTVRVQPVPEDFSLNDSDDRLTADEAHVDQQVLAMLPHSLRVELAKLAQGVPVAAFPVDLDDEEMTVDAAVLAALTPALRAELDNLRRGEPVKGTAIDPDAELAKYGRNIDP